MRLLRSVVLTALLLPAAAHAAIPSAANPITAENARPGTDRWNITPPADPGIEGYASETSVTPGGAFHLHVKVRDHPGDRYRVIVYRLGWYGGTGGRQLACIPGCDADEPPVAQPAKPPLPGPRTGVVRARWRQTDVVHVGRSWVSGYYLAQLRITAGPDNGAVGRVPLVVRAGAQDHAAILVQVPVNTWQAYNQWGGKSLYTYNSTDGIAAIKVSFDRPLSEAVKVPVPWSVELPAMRFLEREGADVSYMTDADVDRTPHRLLTTGSCSAPATTSTGVPVSAAPGTRPSPARPTSPRWAPTTRTGRFAMARCAEPSSGSISSALSSRRSPSAGSSA